jgi:hypothetical protein
MRTAGGDQESREDITRNCTLTIMQIEFKVTIIKMLK